MGSMQNALERALPIVAAAYGEQFGVRVVLSGSDAYTNGETIVLPALRGKDMENVLFGYLAHESGHVRSSHFGVMQHCNSDIERSLTNLIEDIRIESLMMSEFPGTYTTLAAVVEYVIGEGMAKPAQSDDNEASQLFNYLFFKLRYEELGQEVCKEGFDQSLATVEATFPEGFMVRLNVLLGKHIPQLSQSVDCLKLARKILKALQEEEEKEQQQQQQQQQDQNNGASGQDDQSQGGSSDSSGDDQSGDQSQGGSSDSSGDDQSGDQSQSGSSDSDGDDDSDDQGTDGDSDSSGTPNGQANQDGSNPDGSESGDQGNDSKGGNGSPLHDAMMAETDLPADAIKQLEGDLKEKARDQNYGVGSFALDADSSGDLVMGKGDVSTLEAGILASSGLRARLAGLLAAQSRRKQFLGSRGKKVSGRRLCRVATGDSRVFLRDQEVRRPDTAVHVVLDRSGSMGRIQHIANQAAVSLGLALTTIPKVDMALSVFPGEGGDVSPVIRRGQAIRPNLERCAIASTGGTPMADAMLYAAKELGASHKERKVLIVITDGEPNCTGSVEYIRDIISPYVDIYAIGIQHGGVRNLFKNSVVINNVSELQAALFSIAGKFLDLK